MSWNNFSPSVNKEITNSISDTKLTYDCIGEDTIKADVVMSIQVGEQIIPINASASKYIKVKAPNLQTYDGKFICSYDDKFIDIQEGD